MTTITNEDDIWDIKQGLIKTKVLIQREENWMQNEKYHVIDNDGNPCFIDSPKAKRYSLQGALIVSVMKKLNVYSLVEESRLSATLNYLYPFLNICSLMQFTIWMNSHSHKETIELLDKAIDSFDK